MKKYFKGKYIEMTDEEIEAMKTQQPPATPPSLEDRLAALEQGFEKIENLFSKLGG